MTPRRSVEVVLHALARAGFDVRARVRLPRGTGDVDDATYDAIWERARADGLAPHHLLEMAPHYVVGAIGPHDVSAFSEPTVADAVRSLAQSWPSIADPHTHLVVEARGATLRLAWRHGSSLAKDPWTDTFVAAAIFDRLRAHARRSLRPLRVALPLATPTDRRPFEQFFRPLHGVTFNADAASITLVGGDGAIRLVTANVALARHLAGPAAAPARTALQQTEFEVRRWLAHGAALVDVARGLGVNERLLQRRLQADGTTYRQVREAVAIAEARWWLVESSAPIAEIAERIGFANQATFTRAFSRHMHVAPARFRALMCAEGG